MSEIKIKTSECIYYFSIESVASAVADLSEQEIMKFSSLVREHFIKKMTPIQRREYEEKQINAVINAKLSGLFK